MTEKSFMRLVNRYAEAVKELSWTGSQLTGEQARLHEKAWMEVKKDAKKKLIALFRRWVA